MKLLVFAHKPPPHHGQSYMVKQLLETFGGDTRETTKEPTPQAHKIQCYHVDCRFSQDVDDIGRFRPGKLFLVFKYCAQAIACRWRFGVTNFLYIPAPGLRSAIYRDWLVMALCRAFFPKRIFYWQAAGLSEWMEGSARPWERWFTRKLLGEPALSIVLGEYCRRDAEALGSGQTIVVPNAVPDPCPDFEVRLEPLRVARSQARRQACRDGLEPTGEDRWFKVLFLSLCTREKGLFDALEAVALVNSRLAQKRSPIRIQLNVGGKFWRADEQTEFEQRIAAADLNGAQDASFQPIVRYLGFVTGEQKQRLFTECDALCFPSYYSAESFGIVIVEAMAFGLPVITTRWRTIPELLPQGYFGLVEPRSVNEIAARLELLLEKPYEASLRSRFLKNYTIERWAERLGTAFNAVQNTQ